MSRNVSLVNGQTYRLALPDTTTILRIASPSPLDSFVSCWLLTKHLCLSLCVFAREAAEGRKSDGNYWTRKKRRPTDILC
jgi:hypothetical protein